MAVAGVCQVAGESSAVPLHEGKGSENHKDYTSVSSILLVKYI